MSDRPSIRLQGIGASPGIALGRVHLLDRRRPRTPRFRVEGEGIEEEVARLDEALRISDGQLAAMKGVVEEEEGADHALLLEAHRLMLQDPSFVDAAKREIREGRVNAERAVRRAARRIRESLGRAKDEYLRERRAEVDFVGDRLVRNLMGERADPESLSIPLGCVLVARDLSPTDAAMLLHPERVRGLVMERGTQVSHTSIIAHARRIPAVVGAARIRDLLEGGDRVAVDGSTGEVVIHPAAEEEARFLRERERIREAERTLGREAALPSTTRDGAEVRLCANLEFEEEIPRVLGAGAQGIGLLRTEFLYLGRGRAPSEEEHYRFCRRVLERMGDRPVTFRTFDIGADKLARNRGGSQPNPALGLRALRLATRHPGLLETQLRGILRSAVHGRARIMFPMVSGVAELRWAKEALRRAADDLSARGVAFAEVPVGAMIELPSAVLAADRLAKEVDFFSIGTNDLIQYAFAVDRHNREVAYLYRPLDPSILRMLRMTVEAAEAEGIPVAVCGEMAGEPLTAWVLLGLGIGELSMAPASIPHVRHRIRESARASARAFVEEALALSSAEEVEALLRERLEAARTPQER